MGLGFCVSRLRSIDTRTSISMYLSLSMDISQSGLLCPYVPLSLLTYERGTLSEWTSLSMNLPKYGFLSLWNAFRMISLYGTFSMSTPFSIDHFQYEPQ